MPTIKLQAALLGCFSLRRCRYLECRSNLRNRSDKAGLYSFRQLPCKESRQQWSTAGSAIEGTVRHSSFSCATFFTVVVQAGRATPKLPVGWYDDLPNRPKSLKTKFIGSICFEPYLYANGEYIYQGLNATS